jgi:hypothetical protein
MVVCRVSKDLVFRTSNQAARRHNIDIEQRSALLLQINQGQGIHHNPSASALQGGWPRARPLPHNYRGAARQKSSTSSRGNFAISTVVHEEVSSSIESRWSDEEVEAVCMRSAQAHSHAPTSANALSIRRRIGVADDQGFRGFGGRSSIRWAFRCGEADGRVSRGGGGSSHLTPCNRASKWVRKAVLGKEWRKEMVKHSAAKKCVKFQWFQLIKTSAYYVISWNPVKYNFIQFQ